jgi:tetratricopeptide (TPR) repeat protein
MHQRVAQALEDLYGADPGEHLGELALHWRLAAVSVDKAKAADYALKAGHRSLENLAPAEAVKLFADAVELIGEAAGRERCEALIGLGEAQRQTGVAAFRETLLQASRMAAGLADAELAAKASLANSRGHVFSLFGAVDDERVGAIERAIELDDGRDQERRARLLANKAQELSWDEDLERRRALAEEAIALARGTGDAKTLADVLQRVHEPLRVPNTLELRRNRVDELAVRAAELGDPALRFAAHQLSFNISAEHGDFERAEEELEQMEMTAHELDQPTTWWVTTYGRAAWKLVRGELTAGEELSLRAFEIGREPGGPDSFTACGTQLAFVRRYQGRAAEIIAAVKESAENLPIPAWRAGPAWMLCALDRRTEARQLFEQLEGDRFEHVAYTANSGLVALALYADIAVETGSSSTASSLYRVMEPWADQFVFNGLCGYGHVRMWLGLLAASLGEHEEADRHLAFASEFHDTNGAKLWSARTRLGWAEALASRGDADGAREHAIRALELSRQHGYGLFELRAAALVEAESAAGT